MKRPFTLIQMD